MTLDGIETIVIPYINECKDYPSTHPLQQYAQMINLIVITKCSPKWYCDGVSLSMRMAQYENGAMVQYENGSMAQYELNGSMAQYENGAIAQYENGATVFSKQTT